MATLKEYFSKELSELQTLRDELRLKAHLAKADFKDELTKLDAKWPAVEKAAQDIEAASAEVGTQIEKAAKEVFADLRKAYDELVTKSKSEPPAQGAPKV